MRTYTDTDPGNRDPFITGLRQLADYLDTHPDVPCPWHAMIGIHADPLETGGREQVNQIAAALGIGIASYSSDTHYYTDECRFGPIIYYAVSISHEEMARYQALHSYTGSVVPDEETVA